MKAEIRMKKLSSVLHVHSRACAKEVKSKTPERWRSPPTRPAARLSDMEKHATSSWAGRLGRFFSRKEIAEAELRQKHFSQLMDGTESGRAAPPAAAPEEKEKAESWAVTQFSSFFGQPLDGSQ